MGSMIFMDRDYSTMKFSISLKDIMIAPGKRFDPSLYSPDAVIKKIKDMYGVIADVMDISIQGEMVTIEFRDSTRVNYDRDSGYSQCLLWAGIAIPDGRAKGSSAQCFGDLL
jgi:hypothetical protein